MRKASNDPWIGEDGRYYRVSPAGVTYRCCEAFVYPDPDSDESRLCRAAAQKEDRLCGLHARQRELLKIRHKWAISINKRGTQPFINKHGFKSWPKFYIGKLFDTEEQAKDWCRLNGTLIFSIPLCISYCIERIR